MEAAMCGAVHLSALLAFFLAFTISSRCSAQQEEGRIGRTADQFIATYKDAPPSIQEMANYILAAAESGFSYYLEVSKVKLYCRPADVTLTGTQAFAILSKEVENDPSLGKTPWVLALLEALQKTFPCK
jgi:hypothetical protein